MDIGSWETIARAIDVYSSMGYQYIDVPWCADASTIMMTYGRVNNVIDGDLDRCLVGSAEQSFLSIRETLKPGSIYISCTPCFRQESLINYLNRPYFMKVEMFCLGEDKSKEMLNSAKVAMNLISRGSAETSVVKTHDGFDLEISGIEVGSYGFTSTKDVSWSCGTGIAEPRFSVAVRSSK